MFMTPTLQCCFDGFHPELCIQTDTAVEVNEIEQPDGSMLIDVENVEIRHCINCSAVLQWGVVKRSDPFGRQSIGGFQKQVQPGAGC